MTRQLEIERVLDGFLADGVHQLADHVLDAALADISTTPQRRSWWPTWRFAHMNIYAKAAVAVAAVLVVLIAGYNMLPGNGPGGEPTPTPIATPTPTPQLLADAPLRAGTVVARLRLDKSINAIFTVPEGWHGFSGGCVLPDSGTEDPDGMGLCFLEVVTGLYSDPCHGQTPPADVPIGPTVEGLASALAEQTAYEATAPTDVTLGGYSGKRLDLHLPSEVDSCDESSFTPWDGSIYAQGPDNLWRVWIVDVDGQRVIVVSSYFAGTSAQDLAEQQAIVDSIRFEP